MYIVYSFVTGNYSILHSRPYIMDLGSTNGTFINVSKILLILCLSMIWHLLFPHSWSNRVSPGFHELNVNLTFFLLLQDNRIESQKWYELLEKDTIKFGNSR